MASGRGGNGLGGKAADGKGSGVGAAGSGGRGAPGSGGISGSGGNGVAGTSADLFFFRRRMHSPLMYVGGILPLNLTTIGT